MNDTVADKVNKFESTRLPDEPPKAKRKRRSSTTRANRTLDPGIKAIREKMALEV